MTGKVGAMCHRGNKKMMWILYFSMLSVLNRLSISFIPMLCGRRGLGMRLPVYLMSWVFTFICTAVAIYPAEWMVSQTSVSASACLTHSACVEIDFSFPCMLHYCAFSCPRILLIHPAQWMVWWISVHHTMSACFSLQTQSCIMHVLWYDCSLRSHALLILWRSGRGFHVPSLLRRTPQCIALI